MIVSRGVGSFFDLGIVLKVFFHWFVAIKTARIALLGHENRLTSHFSLNIKTSFNNLLPFIEIQIVFIEVKLY